MRDTACASCAFTDPTSERVTTRLPFTSPNRMPTRANPVPGPVASTPITLLNVTVTYC